MRDINRIDPFLEEFGKFWKQNPDIRFGQLVSNIITRAFNEGEHINLFYIEDDRMLNLIKEFNNKGRL